MLARERGATQATATMTVAEAARRLGWTEKQVRNALHAETLQGFKRGEWRWSVVTESVEAKLRYAPLGEGGPEQRRLLKEIALQAAELAAKCLRLEAGR